MQAPAVAAAPVMRAPPPGPAPAPVAARARIPEPPPAIEAATLPPPPSLTASDVDFAVDIDVSPMTPPPPAGAPAPVPPAHEVQVREASPAPASERPTVDKDASGAPPSIEQGEVLADEESLRGDEDDEIQAPASSRRAVTPAPEERLAQLAFGAGEAEPPRHTPPPKSGRLPSPPTELLDDVTAVRESTPIAAAEDSVHPSVRTVQPSVLVPQTSRPNLGPLESVPDVIGQAQNFAPSTFLALLDASLSL